jgi:preprotein translocase subunit SecE
MGFLRQVWAELKKVVWPTRSETIKYSIIVIILSMFVAFYLGAVDYGLLKVFETILNK